MTFSVAIPAYKPQFLGEAVRSVMAQSFASWELVIVDDCYPYDLHAIVEPYLNDSRVRYFRNENNIGALNVVDNWNRCLAYCKGDFVICMGDDDRLLPNCLGDLSELIQNYPGLGVYHIQAEMINEDGVVIESFPPRPGKESALDLIARRWRKNSRQFIGDFCFDLPCLREAGGFYKLPLAWGSDDISAFRAAATGIANTQRPGFQYRQSAFSLSSEKDFEIKVAAAVRESELFEDMLDSWKPASKGETLLLNDLRMRRGPYFRYLCGEYIKTDIGRSPGRVRFWLRHAKESRLSVGRILVQGAKGVVLHILGKL